MGCFFCGYLLADLGSNKLENQHPHVPRSLGRSWEMDCSDCYYSMTLLASTSARFVLHTWIIAYADWLELPAALILLLVVAPSFFADTIRGSIAGVAICLVIGCYLLQEHIRASGGFRNSFTKSNGISNSAGILLLFLYPVWAAIMYVLWKSFLSRTRDV